MTTILIVDDNMQNQYLLESILKGYRFSVVTANNGAEAWEAAKNHSPDLIITDILMPVMDGFELCRKWRADEQLSQIPFIFYTATYTDPRDEKFAMSLGADRFIVKPQKPEVLIQVVQEVLEETRGKSRVTPETPPEAAVETLQQYNEVLFRKLEKKMRQLEEEVTGRKRVEEELRASEKFLNNIVEHIPDMIVVKDARDLRFVRLNKAGEDLLGYSRYELLGKNDHDFFPAPEADFFTGKDREVLRNNQMMEIPEETIQTRDKGERILHTKKIPIADEEGKPAYLLGISEDITEKKQAEIKNRLLAAIVESTDDAIIAKDLDGTIVSWNRGAEKIFGYLAGEMIGKCIATLIPEDNKNELENILSKIRRGEHIEHYETIRVRKDGEKIQISLTISPIRDGDGRITGAATIGRDITEKKRAEEKILLTNRKLSLMTDITYQDIQNKVTALRGYVGLSAEVTSEGERRIFIGKEQEVLQHIQQLIEKTKDYQQMGKDSLRWHLLEPAIQAEAVTLVNTRGVDLAISLNGLALYTDPLIDRVFHNLIDNAVTHGRTLTRISFRYHETPDGLILFCEDDGVGIPPDEKERIFRRVVGGKGRFGLFFTREFLNLSGMTIRETGEPGKGARFEISVPKGMYRFIART